MRLKRPFLKWAGGKTRLVPAIRALAPAEARRLIEPFAGGGAVALNLPAPATILADASDDLISVYRELKRDGARFIAQCAALFTPAANSAGVYYQRRAEFNATKNRRRKACLFLYLNRHGYNGLCRYNARGGFNVPFGRHAAPRFPREELKAFQTRLKSCRLATADFRTVLTQAGPGDFVYCDPPYVPVSATAHFTAYAKTAFGPREQADLAACCRAATRRGAHVVISNHDTAATRALYADADELRGLAVPRQISCVGTGRRAARELLVVYRPADKGRAQFPAAQAGRRYLRLINDA